MEYIIKKKLIKDPSLEISWQKDKNWKTYNE